MAVFKLGSSGDEVKQIQQKLQAAGLYAGAVDGVFGGGSEAAVKAFQTAQGLAPDGTVGPQTWAKLFGQQVPVPDLTAQPVAERCLALTGSFETSTSAPDCFACLAGDFDGQGMSFGAVQFNFGMGTLQPILQGMLTQHPDVMDTLFHTNLPALRDALAGGKSAALAFARSIQDPVRHTINEPWRGMFKALGLTPECQSLQVQAVDNYTRQGQALAAQYQLWSERGAALMFDIAVQNGGIGAAVKALIQADVAALPAGLSAADREVATLRSIANRRAEAAKKAFVEDVRQRKLCIANGTGAVHGITYDLEAQFGIRLQPVAAG